MMKQESPRCTACGQRREYVTFSGFPKKRLYYKPGSVKMQSATSAVWTIFSSMSQSLILPLSFALTLNPSPKAGEGLQSGSPSPALGEGVGR
jgi:hypothetical protein